MTEEEKEYCGRTQTLHASLAVYTPSRLFPLAKGLNVDLVDFRRRPWLSLTLRYRW